MKNKCDGAKCMLQKVQVQCSTGTGAWYGAMDVNASYVLTMAFKYIFVKKYAITA